MTAATAPRRTARLLGLVGACAIAVAALSGCLKLDADLTINADATASGTLDIEFQKEAASFLGISDLASFEENFTGDELDAGLEQFTDCTTSESDAAYVYSCTFEDEAFEGTDNPWTITKEGSLITLRVVNEGQSGEGDALLGDASLGSISVSATFPGPITAVSGDGAEKTSDTTATIKGSLTDSIDATVTSEASSQAFSLSTVLVLLTTLAVLALIVIVVVVMIRRRRKADTEDPSSTLDGTGAAAAGAGLAGTAAATDAASAEVAETVVDAEEAPDAAVTETIAVGETVTGAAPDETVVTEAVTEAAPEAAPDETVVTEAVTEAAPEAAPDDQPGATRDPDAPSA